MGRSSAGGGGGSSGGSRGGGSSGGHRVSHSTRSSRSSSSSSRGSHSGNNSYNNSSYHGSRGGSWNRNRVFITNNSFGQVPSGMARTMSGIISTVILLVMVFIFIAVTNKGSLFGSNIPVSTVNRQALSKENVDKTDWFTDDLGWIGNKSKLQSGMKYFYDTTGVQPYLWITDNINGDRWPDDSVIDAELKAMYEEIFTDGQHFLLMYLDAGNGDYITRYYCGPQAKVFMDEEASEILLSYIDHYATSDMDDETFFSTSFKKATDRLMTVTTNKYDVARIVILLVIVVLVIVGFIIILKLRKKNLERQREVLERTREVIDTPLTSSLEERYNDDIQ